MDGTLTLDWFAFTFKAPINLIESFDHSVKNGTVGLPSYSSGIPSQLAVFKSVFPELDPIWEFMEIRGSKNHYNQSIAFGSDFMCFFNESNDNTPIGQNMGVNFEVPSHSLKLFFDLMHIDINESDAVKQMMCLLFNRGCRCSRIDLCYDDHDKVFRAKDFVDFWNRDCFRTHFKRARAELNGQGKQPGSTFYLGNLKKRDKILRIYDKDIQSQGEIDAVRYEFELHTRYAQDMQLFLMENRLQFGNYIRDWFDIIEPIYDDSHRSQCPLNKDWEEFIDKRIFCENLHDILVPVMSKPLHRLSRKHYVEVYLPRVLKDYVSYYGWELLHEVVAHSCNSPNFNFERDSIKLRSMVNDPYTLRGFSLCFDDPFHI